jgi:N6-adenosine-specific RNA methylase IME4
VSTSEIWSELSLPVGTCVCDPPWEYPEGWPPFGGPDRDQTQRRKLPYSSMSVEAIKALPVADLGAVHLYLWTTSRYLQAAFDVLGGWGYKYSQILTWCKPPRGVGPGGRFTITTEFVLFGSSGPAPMPERVDSTWWLWPRAQHSVKPAAFMDMVERVSPGPYLELFARQGRLNWASWGRGYETSAA